MPPQLAYVHGPEEASTGIIQFGVHLDNMSDYHDSHNMDQEHALRTALFAYASAHFATQHSSVRA